MRMKAVCEATGLTDRAVRYYIEEGLIAPDYTESYTGRKTFDFTESDIRQLRDIAVLRKFEFTVEEIRTMLHDPAQIAPTVEALRERKRLEIEQEQALLAVLERLSDPGATVAELALALCAPVQTALVPIEDSAVDYRRILKEHLFSSLRWAVAWAPLAAGVRGYLYKVTEYEYPVFDPRTLLLTLVFLIPSFLILNWPRLSERFGWKKKISHLIWVLCLLSVLPCRIFSLGYGGAGSETTDIRNYRKFDGRCIVNRYAFFDEFFPTWPHYFDHVYNEEGELEEIWLDAKYYYRFIEFMDYTYDIYAEWPYLTQEEFDKEVARVTALFESTEEAKMEPTQYHGYVKLQKGRWTCLMIYSEQEPFVEVDNSYTYEIFAYDPDALRVRYIYCDSLENGADQPYYLQLDWD
ncbi:MAG: MerR family transcriptional regulator [Oscillospiraceae bacterium]|nr:MerR family transcriptional regulator [Oscillospiraceae bacterium]